MVPPPNSFNREVNWSNEATELKNAAKWITQWVQKNLDHLKQLRNEVTEHRDSIMTFIDEDRQNDGDYMPKAIFPPAPLPGNSIAELYIEFAIPPARKANPIVQIMPNDGFHDLLKAPVSYTHLRAHET